MRTFFHSAVNILQADHLESYSAPAEEAMKELGVEIKIVSTLEEARAWYVSLSK